MSQLNHTTREIECPDGNHAILIALDGTVDPASIDDFDAIFDDLISAGNKRIVMDVENLKYINSTGMGIIVQYYDQLAEENGKLVLMSVNAKITLVLEMLGLQELFPIVTTESEAIAALMNEYVAPTNVQVRLADSESGAPTNSFASKCGSCTADLIFTTAGNYLCPRCYSLLIVATDGAIETKKSLADKGSLAMAIPAEAAFYKSTAALAARISLKAGFSDVDARAIADTVTNALMIFATAAYGANSAGHLLNIIACAYANKFTLNVYGGGNKITDSGIFAPVKSVFGQVTCTAINGGNLLTLTKTK